MKALLDTSVVVALDVGPPEGEVAISAATLSELHFGVLVAADPEVRAERLRRLSALARRFDAQPYARDAADLRGLDHLVHVVSV